MAIWNPDNILLTLKGREVLSKVQSGVGKLTVTRIVTGGGYVPTSQLYNQTAVTDEKQVAAIVSSNTDSNGSSIEVQISNKELDESYTVYQLGVYVTHPDFEGEVLYMLAQCDTESADVVPLPSETPLVLSYNLYITHNGTDQFTIEVDYAGMVDRETFNELKKSFDDHSDNGDIHTSLEEKQQIAKTYIKNITASGRTVTFTKGDGSTGTFTTQDTTYGVATSSKAGLVKSGGDITVGGDGTVSVNDNSHNHTLANVTGLQSALDGKAPTSHGTHVTYSSSNPLVAGTPSAGTAATVARSDHVHPAQTSISGNAATATKATSDSLGQNISQTYIKNINASGRTVTYARGDGSTGSFQTQDTVYTHPSTHPASMIVPDSTHRFVTDTEKNTWNAKQNAITGGASTITSANLTASRALMSDGSGKVAVSPVTATELGHLSGVTSPVQTQLNDRYKVYMLYNGGSNLTNYVRVCSAPASIGGGKAGFSAIILGGYNFAGTKIPMCKVSFSPRGYSGSGAITEVIEAVALGGGLLNAELISFIAKLNGSRLELWAKIPPYSYETKMIVFNTESVELHFDSTTTTAPTGTIRAFETARAYTTAAKPTPSDIGAAPTSHTHDHLQITGLSASRALISDSSGRVAESSITSAELSYLDGVTSNIQTQLNGKSPNTHTHNSLQRESLANRTLSLNTLTLNSGTEKIKYYICESDGVGANITGRPDDNSKTAFILDVELIRWASTSDYITKQTYTQGAKKTVFVRYCTSGAWSNWEKVYTSVQKPTPSEIGAAPASHTHDNSHIMGMLANRALISDGSGKLAESAVTSTELSYLSGVTSKVQTQLNNKAPSTHTHGLGTGVFSAEVPNTMSTNGWGDLGDEADDDFMLKSCVTAINAPEWSNRESAVIAFGGHHSAGYTAKASISVAGNVSVPAVVFAGGDGASPAWSFQITGANKAAYNLAYLAGLTANIQQQLNSKAPVTPPGVIQAFAGSKVPEGWQSCDGRALSRTEYADLFAAIGTLYGSGDGKTTFNLPKLTGRSIIGSAAGGLGRVVGEETHQLTATELASHNHYIGAESAGSGYWLYGSSRENLAQPGQYTTGAWAFRAQDVAPDGGNAAHNNIPPSLYLMYIIKT